jgi:hypothetical protein
MWWAATVMAVTAAAVTATQGMVKPTDGPMITVVPMDTSKPLAPPPTGFPDLDSFTDVSRDHDVSRYYPLSTFTSPTGLQCAMWSSRGDTAAFCFGAIPGLDHPANQVYAGDYTTSFDLNPPPNADKLNGRPLASGEKVILGAGGNLIGGDQITCGAEDLVVACMVIRDFRRNHGDDSALRHGFVLRPEGSWTF